MRTKEALERAAAWVMAWVVVAAIVLAMVYLLYLAINTTQP